LVHTLVQEASESKEGKKIRRQQISHVKLQPTGEKTTERLTKEKRGEEKKKTSQNTTKAGR